MRAMIQIDVVGLETLQARVDRFDDVLSRQPKRWGRPHRRKALGRQDDPVAIAARFHPAPDDRFRWRRPSRSSRRRIRICGVEEMSGHARTRRREFRRCAVVYLKPNVMVRAQHRHFESVATSRRISITTLPDSLLPASL